MLHKLWKRIPSDFKEIQMACSGGDAAAARRAAHALCGTAGNLSAIGVHEAAARLEEHLHAGHLNHVAPSLEALGSELDYLLGSIEQLLDDWKKC